jgi:hypothetical protein
MLKIPVISCGRRPADIFVHFPRKNRSGSPVSFLKKENPWLDQGFS